MTTLITRAQFIRLGGTDTELERACRDGRLARVRRGVYASTSELTKTEAHLRLIEATLPSLSPDAVLSHASAAVIHGLAVDENLLDRVWITRPGQGHGKRRRLVVQHRAALTDTEVVEVGGHHVTSLARTAADMARTNSFEWGVATCDSALHLGLPMENLLAAVDGGPSRWGSPMARKVAAFADGLAESPIESWSRIQCARHGIPKPVLQFEVWRDGVLVGRSDFGWPELATLGEADGRIKYDECLRPGETPADAVMREKRRDEDVRLATGWWVTRWGRSESLNGPALAEHLRRAFAIAERLRS